MKTRRNGIMLAMVAVLLSVVCVNSWSQSKQTTDIFADEIDGILTVDNETSIDIVLFAGRVERGIVLGGIRADSSRSFDISKKINIHEIGMFIIRGVSAENYRRKGRSLTENDVLYSSLFFFDPAYDTQVTNTISFEIDETMSTGIIVSNNSSSVCLLWLDDIELIAVLSPFQQNKTLWIKPSESGMPRMIYPTFIFVDHDGTLNETVLSNNNGLRFDLKPWGSEMRIFQFRNPEGGDGQLNLLFE